MLTRFLANEWRHLVRMNPSNRPWEMPAAAALATGLPIAVGTVSGSLPLGLAGSLGGLVFLSMPATALRHRMVWVSLCALAMTACHALGLLCHEAPALTVPLLALLTLLVTALLRSLSAPPPGPVFFVMAAAIGAYSPAHGKAAVEQLMAVAAGSLGAVGIALAYSLHMRHHEGPLPPTTRRRHDLRTVWLEATLIGSCVGLSLLAAQVLQMPRPYWVPISCLAVVQGASLHAAWSRQLHRILGTLVGLGVFAMIVQLPLHGWMIVGVATTLAFIIETLVVRHYGLATVFFTPMALLLAEYGAAQAVAIDALMRARLLDTVLGAFIGLLGAACLHSAVWQRIATRTS